MPTTIATGYRNSSFGGRRIPYGAPRRPRTELVVAVWALAVLLIAVLAHAHGQPVFLDEFDVSVAPF
jgi:hypothetical protein